MLTPLVDPDKETREPSIHEILGLPEDGIPLGFYSENQHPYQDPVGDDFVTYRLELGEMQNQHILILGDTGTGKTTFLKHLARQLVEQDRAVVAFDVQSDIVQMIEQIEDEELENLAGSIELGLWEDWDWWDSEAETVMNATMDADQYRILAPVLDNDGDYNQTRIDQVEAWCDDRDIEFDTFSLNFNSVNPRRLPVYMPELTDKAQNTLVPLAQYYQNQVGGSLDHFRKWITQQASWRDDNPRWENDDDNEIVQTHSSTYGNLLRQLDALRNLGIFDVHGAEEPPYDDFAEAGVLTIVYLDHLYYADITSIFEFHIPSLLLNHRNEIPETHTLVDEAHEVIPKGRSGQGNYADVAASEFSEIAREGRKFDLNLIVSTHKPKDINSVVYSLCGTNVIFRVDPEDLSTLQPPSRYERMMSGYRTGYAIVNPPGKHA